jgi:hypothetical protein
MILIDTKQIKAEYLPDYQCLKYSVSGYNYGVALRDVFNKFLEFGKQYKIINWLSNYRDAEILEKEDIEWFLSDWWPRAHKELADGKKWAIIASEDIFMRMGVKVIVSQFGGVPGRVVTQYFESEVDALKWFKED